MSVASANRYQEYSFGRTAMSLEKEDGAVEKLVEQAQKSVDNNGDKYDELNKLDVSDLHAERAYAGMGKEELMKYANSPFWVRLRWLLFVTFWLSWFAMMFGALFIIFVTPKCYPSSKLEWYQKSPVYVVNAASLAGQDGTLSSTATRAKYDGRRYIKYCQIDYAIFE